MRVPHFPHLLICSFHPLLVSEFIHTTPLCVPCPLLCVLLCPPVSPLVSSHSRQSVREPVEPRIVKHPRLETRHRPWETTQSRAADLAEKAGLCDGQLPQFGEAACRLVGDGLHSGGGQCHPVSSLCGENSVLGHMGHSVGENSVGLP